MEIEGVGSFLDSFVETVQGATVEFAGIEDMAHEYLNQLLYSGGDDVGLREVWHIKDAADNWLGH